MSAVLCEVYFQEEFNGLYKNLNVRLNTLHLDLGLLDRRNYAVLNLNTVPSPSRKRATLN